MTPVEMLCHRRLLLDCNGPIKCHSNPVTPVPESGEFYLPLPERSFHQIALPGINGFCDGARRFCFTDCSSVISSGERPQRVAAAEILSGPVPGYAQYRSFSEDLSMNRKKLWPLV